MFARERLSVSFICWTETVVHIWGGKFMILVILYLIYLEFYV